MPDGAQLNVSRETFQRLEAFHHLLRRWNKTINLISAREIDLVWERHIRDSLRLIPYLPPGCSITDLGSGAGFPGLILAIATGRQTTLVEADQRKAAFLREASRITETLVDVIATRIEASGLRELPLITARALAPLSRLLDLSAPILAPDGVCLFLKGSQLAAELTEAERKWQMTLRTHPSLDAQGGVVLEVSHLRRNQSGSV